MEKMLWINSWSGMKAKDGLDEVNHYLADGWKVKLVSACAMGDCANAGQAYVVIEKEG